MVSHHDRLVQEILILDQRWSPHLPGLSEPAHHTSMLSETSAQLWSVAMLQISPEKVGHIILKAKEYSSKVAAWDDSGEAGDAAEEPDSILEDFKNDTTARELATFIAGLNVDEQNSLVALAWVGRGTYTADEFDEAVATAREERVNPTHDYLMGIPLLSEYLAEGLELMGVSAIDAEEDLLGTDDSTNAAEK
jgi:hypothetical protein